MSFRLLAAPAAVAAFVAFVPLAHAADPAQNCEAAKLKTAGKYGACRLTQQSKAVKTGGLADFTKCDSKFASKWQSAEDKSDGLCPTALDLSSLQDVITDHADNVGVLLSGETGGDPDAVYVTAGSGTDVSGCGAIDAPCASITFGLGQAVTDGRLRVYVSALEYAENVALVDGIDLLGGYDPATWQPTTQKSVIYGLGGAGHVAAVTASGVSSSTSFEGFVVHGATATTAGANSYGIRVASSSANLSIRDIVVYAGTGAPRGPSSDGSDGATGVDGLGRESNPSGYDGRITTGVGACNASNDRAQANGGQLVCPGAVTASGGSGGGNHCPASSTLVEGSGIDGANGTANPSSGGDAGDDGRLQASGTVCESPAAAITGASGAEGEDGVDGVAGGGCSSAAGIVSGGHWIAGAGVSGSTGAAGSGGGGGGAGGGAFCTSCTEGKDRFGGHGGGGGSGGCGGTGGATAAGGGGSFGIFVVGGAAPQISDVTVALGSGGGGGVGGRGGNGGEEGKGATGGTSSLYCTGNAGKGGDGGRGGHGGGGGGGCGGSSYGVYTSGVGTPDYCMPASNITFLGGAAGSGGLGGQSLGNPGGNGASGLVVPCSLN